MKPEDVKAMFDPFGFHTRHGVWTIGDKALDLFAAAIAEAVGEENAELQAQVAEMQKALEWIVQEDNPYICEGNYPDPADQVYASVECAKKALAAVRGEEENDES